NIGSPLLLEGVRADGTIEERARQGVESALRQAFRPEFLNRIDEIALFKPLTKREIERIVGLQLQRLGQRLQEQGLTLEPTEEALTFIANSGYDPTYGARPLKRYIQRHVET